MLNEELGIQIRVAPPFATFQGITIIDVYTYKKCHFHFTCPEEVVRHKKIMASCHRNLHEKQRFLISIGDQSYQPHPPQNSSMSPNLNGRESRLSFNSDQNDSAYHASPADILHYRYYIPRFS